MLKGTRRCRSCGAELGDNEVHACPGMQFKPTPKAREVQLGVIEFHPQEKLRERFYEVVDDLIESASIVDVWLLDIAATLAEYGYTLTITTEDKR